MNNALATLFYVFDTGAVDSPPKDARVLFIGARAHHTLAELAEFCEVDYVQNFKPYADELFAHSYSCLSDNDVIKNNQYDLALILPEKNKLAARAQIAHALIALKKEGMLIVCASNDAGGKSLPKMLAQFGVSNIQNTSKNKARAVWGLKLGIDETATKDALKAGEMQRVDKTGFIAQAGMYGWNKIDAGSALLAQHLPANLSGIGADFGCGYGYLARHVLELCEGIRTLHCIDAYARALKACEMNLNPYTVHADKAQYLWTDLTTPLTKTQPLDFVIMNPPFHEGKNTDTSIGQNFIKTAHASLKKGGALYMVANTHLPYERVLNTLFRSHELLTHENGFKVFVAVK